MRIPATLCLLLATPLLAQDAAQLANQQMQIQMQTQTQMQLSQQTNLQNQQINQQLLLDQTGLAGYRMGADKPVLTVAPNPATNTVTVRMNDKTRGSFIFYTTDGWTPTASSKRYAGPVVVDRDMTLQAVALAPGSLRSSVVVFRVTMPGPADSHQPSSPDTVQLPGLSSGTALTLFFTAPVVSQSLQVGDKLPVALAQNIHVNGALVAPRLTPVLATVAQVDRRGRWGTPASITFTVQSVTLADGSSVPLVAIETMEGEPHTGKASAIGAIPFVGLSSMRVRGGEAVIPQGARLTAHIAGAATATGA